MQGYSNLANIAVINPLSTLDPSKSQQLYNGYPNPKKARLIQQVVLSKSISESNNDLNNIGILPKLQSQISNDQNSYSSIMSGTTAPYFCSSALLEPYMINADYLNQSSSQAFDISRLPSSTKTYCSFPSANSALSSIFLAGSGIEWTSPTIPTSAILHTVPLTVSPDLPKSSDSSKLFCLNNSTYPSTYGECSDMASSLLHNLKSREAFMSPQDYGRYHDSNQYLGYDQPNTAWYKLKEETRSTCPVVSNITSEHLTNGYDYNYREMKEKRKCDVCGDVSAGFHCSAFVCEACKKFFIRSSKGENYTKYSCTKSNNCEIVKDTRTHCQYCRFQKCIQLGMTLPGANLNQTTDISLIPCRVCGAQSSGFHFGAITCEGCKGFFRRTINERENQKYSCRNGGNCVINLATRNNCKSCRYKKCINVGMSKEGSRIGRQPNAIKHMCAKEINQIRAGLALNHFATSSGHPEPGLLQSYLPNQLSSAIISSMNIDFNQSRYLQSSVQPTSSEFYLAPNSTKYPIYNIQAHEQARACKQEMDTSHQTYLQTSVDRLFLHRPNSKLLSSSSNFELEFDYEEKERVARQVLDMELSSFSGSNLLHDEKRDFMSTYRGPGSSNKSDDNDSRYIRDMESSFVQDSAFISSMDRCPLSNQPKFSVDMPLHKFLSDVNIAAKCLCNCRRKTTKEFQLFLDSDEITVWDAMMQHFQAHAVQVIKFAKGVPGFKDLGHNDMKVLVQEGMYPIILVQLARDFNLNTEEYNYFNFSNNEKEVILNKFSIFNKIAEQVLNSGRLIKPKYLDETLFSLICYIELVKGDWLHTSDACSIANRSTVNLMYKYSINALRLYMTEIGSTQNEIDSVLEILPILSKMTQEHQNAVMMLRNTKPHLKFPNLYMQMFSVD